MFLLFIPPVTAKVAPTFTISKFKPASLFLIIAPENSLVPLLFSEPKYLVFEFPIFTFIALFKS